MRYFALLPALALALAACSDAPVPSEPEGQPEQVVPMFSTTVSSSGYTAIDLGTLGGSSSYAYAINEVGQVVGSSETASGRFHAFLWDAETGMQDLGVLEDIPGNWSYAYAINDAGQVVGRSYAEGQQRAFLWGAETGMQDLGTIPAGDRGYYEAYGINNDGQVVGTYTSVYNTTRAFLWDGTMHDLDLGGGQWGKNWARGISNTGQVVGWRFYRVSPINIHHAVIWSGGTFQDLGTLGGHSEGYAINDAGYVVGGSERPGDWYMNAFLWDGTTMHDLGNLPGGLSGNAYDINDAGQVVGQSGSASGSHAFLWDRETGMVDLGTLGGSKYGDDLTGAAGINNSGWIVGHSIPTDNRVPHATLWRVLTPLEQLENCAVLAEALEAQGVLNQGQAHSFVNKINLATAALNDGKTTPAINKLEAFQNEASGYVNGGKLTQEQGDELISCVQRVIDSL